jgi:hypothetical protein
MGARPLRPQGRAPCGHLVARAAILRQTRLWEGTVVNELSRARRPSPAGRLIGPGSHGAGTDSGPRVVRVVQLLEASLEDVRVDLRGGKVCVAKHHLNRTKVGPPIQQVCGE